MTTATTPATAPSGTCPLSISIDAHGDVNIHHHCAPPPPGPAPSDETGGCPPQGEGNTCLPPVAGSKLFTGVAVNNAPTATNLGAAEAYIEDVPLDLTDIVVSDLDSANITARLTLSSAAAGAPTATGW